jgi:3-hydroxybutyryl-CoA dehydrogenase
LHETVNDVQWQDVLLVVESIPEHLASKHELLRRIEQHARPSALITTNTSSLRIADVTGVLERPRRSAGLHFGLPAHVMPAVEVTPAGHTAPATVRKLVAWMEELGKVPVLLKKDVPGMLINRLQHAMYREIYHLMETGIADAIDIDRAVRFGFGLRYAIAGPVVSRDIHGVPVHLQVARQLYPTLHNGSTPSHLLEDMVRQGRHGVRTGRGFYKWDKKTVDVRLGHFNQLLEEAVRRITRRGEPTEF